MSTATNAAARSGSANPILTIDRIDTFTGKLRFYSMFRSRLVLAKWLPCWVLTARVKPQRYDQYLV